MKRIILSIMIAGMLTTACIVAMAVTGQSPTTAAASLQQDTPPDMPPLLQLDLRQQVPLSVSVQTEIETTGTQTITIPLLIDLQSLITLAGQEPVSAVLVALASPVASELQTVTVSIPATFTPQITVNVITPSVATTQTLAVTTTVPITDSDAITTLLPTVTVNANVRAEPSTEADIVGQVIGGSVITPTGQNADGSWYQLDNGYWIIAFVVANVPPDLPVIVDNAVVVTQSVAATVTVPALVLRAGPSIESDRLGAYPEGSVVAVTGRAPGNEWVNVVTPDGNSGWMFVEFLELSVPLEAIPVLITTQQNLISGRIQDEAGEGVNDILVAALQQADTGSLRVDATSTSTGTFSIFTPPGSADSWRLEIVGLGCDSRIVDADCQLDGYYILTPTVDVELPMAEDEVVALNVAESTGFLAGSVVGADGDPADAGLNINATRDDDGARTFGVTGADGLFVLPAAPGTWSVTVEDGEPESVEVPAVGSSDPVELTLP